jgi:hypothetical protein
MLLQKLVLLQESSEDQNPERQGHQQQLQFGVLEFYHQIFEEREMEDR